MPVFESASNCPVTNSSFVDVAGDQLNTTTIGTVNQNFQQTVVQTSGDATAKGIRLLSAHISVDALHNSLARSVDTPRCHQHTRVAVKQDILGWASQPNESTLKGKMAWVHGPAGTGKSAIMQDLAEHCAAEKTLAASFFFSYASPQRSAAAPLVATLAYQIAQNVDSLRKHIAAAVIKDPTIFDKDLASQFFALIVSPVNEALKISPEIYRSLQEKTIYIDGLDECRWITEPLAAKAWRDEVERKHDLERRAEMTQTLVLTTLNNPRCPFPVVVASRPEGAMRHFFLHDLAGVRQFVLGEIYNPDDDILLFLKSSFKDIHTRYRMNDVWPSEKDIKTLVEHASGQFIYASTVLRFVDDPECRPEEHLAIVLKLRPSPTQNPLARLHAIYAFIVERCASSQESFTVIRSIKSFDYEIPKGVANWSDEEVDALNLLASVCPSDRERLFGRLHSLVRIPTPGLRRARQDYTFYHKSLHEYVMRNIDTDNSHIKTMEYYLKACIHIQEMSVNSGTETHGTSSKSLVPSHTLLFRHIIMWAGSTANAARFKSGTYANMITAASQLDTAWWASEVIRHAETPDRAARILNSMRSFFHWEMSECRIFRCSKICRHFRKGTEQAVRASNSSLEIDPRAIFYPRLRMFELTVLVVDRLSTGQTSSRTCAGLGLMWMSCCIGVGAWMLWILW